MCQRISNRLFPVFFSSKSLNQNRRIDPQPHLRKCNSIFAQYQTKFRSFHFELSLFSKRRTTRVGNYDPSDYNFGTHPKLQFFPIIIRATSKSSTSKTNSDPITTMTSQIIHTHSKRDECGFLNGFFILIGRFPFLCSIELLLQTK